MTAITGFVERIKGKISAKVAYFISGGIYQDQKAAGFVYEVSGAPTNGTNGTLAGIAGPGKLLVDLTNKTFYQNTNTKASPTWTALTSATGAGTYTGTFDGVLGGNTPAAATITDLVTSGIDKESLATAIVASVTQTRVGGTALTKKWNNVGTVANAGDAVTLPALAVGQSTVVFNNGANSAKVFPNGAADTIDGGAGGAQVNLANTKRCLYLCIAANTIISAQLGAVSA